ncbi:M14 metallopeptidase family protein [Pedobacter alpinus]|uniref:M14 metallopeptidase family protein n=1 Tax=Pedobacter alpinus TaxID=1590643 RepID=A0ABW5TWU1_9SPHI
MKKLYVLIFSVLITFGVKAQTPLSYYLPQNLSYNPNIPKPEDVIGFNIGDQHVSHDQVVMYMKELARLSDRITLVEYAKSYENRKLLLLTITSPDNQKNIEQIKAQHVALSDPNQSANLTTANMPIVVWQGFSVHGNEPSGVNAAMVVAYYLAAAQGAEIDALLKNTVILFDPAINPDGIQRFSTWVNANKSTTLVTDANSREFSEPWPNSRTNHYWFDLNRDWLPLQHNESKGRLAAFHTWKPNILTDHHEQGTNATFFFQPGVPSRTNVLTPKINQELTAKIGEYHAKALDEIASLYFTKENYDDFYYGKGSTYPDINGAIGILFEQASSRGHAQESINGVLKFPFTVKNQVTTAFSTLKAAQGMRVELLDFQKSFYKNATNLAKADAVKGYIFGSADNKSVSYHLLDILKRHQIKVYQLAKNANVAGKTFEDKTAYVVPADQAQYSTIKAIFAKQTQFQDSLFYDISAWTFPLAFNIKYAELSSTTGLLGAELGEVKFPEGQLLGAKSNYAYIFEWNEFYAPKILNELLKQGLYAKVASKPFSIPVNGKIKQFEDGTIMIPVGGQPLLADELFTLITSLAKETGIDVLPVNTGITEGINLGSGNFKNIKQPKTLLVTGAGVNANDAGEVWHLLDQRFNMPPVLVEQADINSISLDKYNVIVMSDGRYNTINQSGIDEIKRFLRNGGTLIAMGDANRWTSANGLTNIKYKTVKSKDSTAFRNYDTQQEVARAQYIPGAIFNCRVDKTHPIAYGISTTEIPVFREGTGMFEKPSNPFAAPLTYTNKPLLAGYISPANENVLKGSAAIICSSYGRGQVVSFSDNPNFRAFWFGTSKLFMNAIFFGQTISGGN